MKKILSSILILTFVFFSGQIIAQKTNDHGGSKVKKEQKELNNNTKDKSKGKTNDKGGSNVKKLTIKQKKIRITKKTNRKIKAKKTSRKLK